MSHGNGPRLELKLNLSPPRDNPGGESPTAATSPPSSCVSSEMNQLLEVDSSSTSLDAVAVETETMLLVGCPRCLMYVMLSGNDPKCPKCKSTVLLDFLHDITTTIIDKTRKS
ncbi:hypothetical protein F3Y22_tig00009009pilonHSYRG00127 [Hibiscus syriacus]|uniref:GIR1-like zinc ribbon domain-containing protein n=2 Tax=Hibiscus syriacus TaxID=106335 RepID=A0A6A3CBC7_HIBSY|nr:hypothetical protein F3Y22_tig00009009pilonHSYRG00127 [Hibiscus syriacus]